MNLSIQNGREVSRINFLLEDISNFSGRMVLEVCLRTGRQTSLSPWRIPPLPPSSAATLVQQL